MASAVLNNSSVGVTRFTGSPLDLPRRAHALLAERFPPARVKHKPLSILRQEARRALEQFFDAQTPPPAKPDRDKMVEDVLGEASGFGPLEELFRDETVKEVMLIAAAQVIVRKDGGWVPTSVRFRDPAHLRNYLRRLADTGEPFVSGGASGEGGFDVRMANGFRVIGLLPPDVLDAPPQAVLVRGLATPTPPPVPLAPPSDEVPKFPSATTSGWVPGSALIRTPPPRRLPPEPITGGSGTVRAADRPRPVPLPVPDAPVSEFYMPANLDPKERVRRKVSERIIRKCAAAGLYDLTAIPAAELQRVILAHVEELNGELREHLSDQEMQIVALEIFTGMRR